jgi:glycosyltransferase involved in cell wall biosynthesis
MQDIEPKVSIVMNCFNGGKYLREALNSVLSQTYKNWELIFWDNQSSDDSAKIFHEYDDDRLKYYYAPLHTVLYEARKNALQQVTGEYIAFLDVDDWWSDDKLSEQMQLFQDNNVGLVYGNYWVKNERKNKDLAIAYSHKLPDGYVLSELLREYVVGILTVIVRRKCLLDLDKVFDSRYQIIGDLDLFIRLASITKFACVQKPIAFYRWHGDNASIKDANRGIAELEQWLTDMHEYKAISNDPSFSCAENRVEYIKIVNDLTEGRRGRALRQLINYPWSVQKIKLLIGLLMPSAMLVKLRA